MSKCFLCGKRGLFLKVNNNGLCKDCELKQKEEELRKKETRLQKEKDKILTEEQRQNGLFPAWLTSYVVTDIETTGLNYQTDDIIEIAAIRVVNGAIDKKYSALISGVCVPDEISSLTGITQSQVDINGRPKHKVFEEYTSIIGSLPLVGHNIKSFDIYFLQSFFKSFNATIENECIDTLDLSKKYLDCYSHKLSSLKSYYELKDGDSHRALGDCSTTLSLYQLISQTAKKPKKQIKSKDITITDEDKQIMQEIVNAVDNDKYLRFKKSSDGYLSFYGFYKVGRVKTEGRVKNFFELPATITNPNQLETTSAGKSSPNDKRYHYSSFDEVVSLLPDIKVLYQEQIKEVERNLYYDRNPVESNIIFLEGNDNHRHYEKSVNAYLNSNEYINPYS